ncbi:MAG: M20/M25/M40 family metallo-hydrolase [Thaumarchaeota archaeon]|nr:M20/M25/M40 family metallo-hydrolase [Nitrososphaerota archaeon]
MTDSPQNAQTKRDIAAWIDSHADQIVKFCSSFVSYQSVTGDELGVQRDFLHPFFKDSMKWDEVDLSSVVSDKERPNLWSVDTGKERPNLTGVMKGTGGGRSLLFNGHVDVVPVTQSQLVLWTVDPWNAGAKDGKLYGRGSSDMKGGITSMIWAVKALMDLGVKTKGTVGMEAVVGEEEMEHGIGTTGATKRLLDKGYHFDFAVDTEPTYNEIHPMSSGMFSMEIYVQGKTVHTSSRNRMHFPQRAGLDFGDAVGVDALPKLLGILDTLQRLAADWVQRWRSPVWGGGGYPMPTDFQGLGLASISVDVLQAGDMMGMIPGFAKASLLVTYPPWVTKDDAFSEVKKAIDSYVVLDTWLKQHPPKVTTPHSWPPYETDPNHPGCQTLARSFKESTGRDPVISGFRAVDDVVFLQKLGIPGVSLGPGDISLGCHGPDEYVPVDQMIECTKALAFFILDWCGESES